MNPVRQCCRPGCRNNGVATLTFDYGESIAVLGPLATSSEPHSWDLCEFHATRMTAPRGWEMLRNIPAFSAPAPAVGAANALDDDLTALADTVRERAPKPEAQPDTRSGGLSRIGPVPERRVVAGFSESDPSTVSNPSLAGRQAANSAGNGPVPASSAPGRRAPKHAAPTRRGHLRVLPDPVD